MSIVAEYPFDQSLPLGQPPLSAGLNPKSPPQCFAILARRPM